MKTRSEHGLWMAAVLILAVLASCTMTSAQEPLEYDADDLVARGLFDAGRAAYDAGNYSEALNYFQQAYEHSGRPRLLYNIGQSADRLRMDRSALGAFRKYLELIPDADNAREVENRVRALERLVADDTEATPAETDAPPQRLVATPTPGNGPTPAVEPREGDQQTTNLTPWLVVGVGGATTVAGLVLFVIGATRIDNVEDAPSRSSWAAVQDDARSGPAYRDAGIATLAFGLVGIAAGVVWIMTSNDEETATVSIGPAGLAVRGTL